MQAEVDHVTDPVEETIWLESLPEPVAPIVYVAYADLRSPDLDDVLQRHIQAGQVRGSRQEAWYEPTSTRADMPRENLLLNPTWRAGLKRLIEHDLSFDLLVWPHQPGQAADVFADVPDLPLIVEHTGMPTLDDQTAHRRVAGRTHEDS